MTTTFTEITGDGASIDREGVAEYTRRWKWITDDETLRALDFLAFAEIPKPFEALQIAGRVLYADKPTAEQDEDVPTTGTIEVPYSSEIEKPEEDKNPLNRAPRISIRSEDSQEPWTFHEDDGEPILNTAKDLIEGLTHDVSNFVFSVTKNVASVPRWVLLYPNAVNSDGARVKGLFCKKGTLKFRALQIPADEETDDGTKYVPLSFELHYRADGWDEPIANRGFNELKTELVISAGPGAGFQTDAGEVEEITTFEKILVGDPQEPPKEPVWLDKDGAAFRDDRGNVRLPTPSEAITIKARTKKLPFSKLPLK